VPTRYLILLIIFIVTAVNYADRATLSIAGTEVAKELQLSAVSMGYIFCVWLGLPADADPRRLAAG
jgi:ACS family probable galactarate transporter